MREADAALARFDEIAISGAMRRAAPEASAIPENERRGAFAEWAAWHFARPSSVADAAREPWGIYWSALFGAVMQDGREIHNPDVAEIDEGILSHWMERAARAVHPAIIARYADLAWEIGRYRKRPAKDRRDSAKPPLALDIPFTLAQLAIDGYLEAVERDLAERDFLAWRLLTRAIGLAISLNDRARIARAKAVLFTHYRKKLSEDGKFQWHWLSDLTDGRTKALELTEDEQREIIQSLEDALTLYSDIARKERFDPHQATGAADRLVRRVTNKPDEVRRVVKRAGAAFEEIAKGASGMLAIAWLEDLIPRYRNAGLIEDAVRVERAIRDRAEQARSEMKTVSHSIEIPKEKMDAWINAVLGENLREALGGIAVHCMMREDDMRKTVMDMKEKAPLMSMLQMSLMNSDGFTEATVKSVEDDPDGRVIKQTADMFQANQILIHNALLAARERYGLDVTLLVGHLNEAPFFAPAREALLREGLAAWLAEDPVKAIHVLVPQVETACRDLLEALGAPVRKADPQSGGFEVIGMGAVINHAAFVAGVPKDIRFHLRALYSDPRGLNLRNHLAHGMAHIALFGMGLANWVVHSLLMLAILRMKPRDVPPQAVGDPPD